MKRTFVICTGLLMLVACATAPTATPTPASTPSVMPTLTTVAPLVPSPTATSTATLTALPTRTATPTPQPTLPPEKVGGLTGILYPSQDLIEQGMRTGVIRQKVVASQLTFEVRDNLNRPGTKIVFARDPATREIVLATRLNSQTQGLEWHVAGLRDFADATGISMGTQLYSPTRTALYLMNVQYPKSDIDKINALVTQEYNHAIVDELSWSGTEQNGEGVFTFGNADAAIALAQANGMTVEGDDLVYGLNNFQFTYLDGLQNKLQDQGLNSDQIKQRFKTIVENHITQVVSRYKGKVTEWSVLNEWRGEDLPQPDKYSKIWGSDEEFIKFVFETARKADPNARLFYNDNHNITQVDWNYKITKSMVDWGLVDAVGEQGEIDVAQPPTKNAVITTMQSYGVPVIVSSAVFDLQNTPGSDAERQQKQADAAGLYLSACLESRVCRDFRFWDGSGDTWSFLRNPKSQATIFDKDQKPKPAYFAIRDVLISSMKH